MNTKIRPSEEQNKINELLKDKGYFFILLYKIVKPKYQIIAMGFFSAVLVSLFMYTFNGFIAFEKRPDIKPILPQELKGISGSSTQVSVGLYINDFPEFNVRENTFVLEGKVWFLFDQAVISLETIGQFSFARGEILSKSDPEIKLIDGNYFAQYNVRVKFKADLNQKYFPLDDHRLYFELENNHVTPKELTFSSSLNSFLLSPDVLVIGWKPIDRFVETGYTETILDRFDPNKNVEHPKVIFAIDFSRVGIQDIFLIFLPLCLMVFISFFSLSLDPPQMSARLFTLALSAITGLMAYRFVLQSIVPQVGYFILSDCFFILFLAVVFLIFCSVLIVVQRNEVTPRIVVFRAAVFLLSYLLLLGFTFYFLFFWPYA